MFYISACNDHPFTFKEKSINGLERFAEKRNYNNFKSRGHFKLFQLPINFSKTSFKILNVRTIFSLLKHFDFYLIDKNNSCVTTQIELFDNLE